MCETQVSFALGHADLLLTPVGTLISAEKVSPIVPMGVLTAELGCKVKGKCVRWCTQKEAFSLSSW